MGDTTRKNPPGALPAAPTEGIPRTEIPGYELVRELGRGGMGVVWEARSLALGRSVALKLIRPDRVPDSDTIARVEREAAAQARLRHPGIVRVHEIGRARGLPWLALELVPGESLAGRIERGGPLPQRMAAAWARELALAMAHAHSLDVLHRDLKPGNVLLGPDERPRLTDFGLALIADEARRLTHTGVVLGSPAYMAPEQATGDPRSVGPHTDVYGLGAILYEMLTGRSPHPGGAHMAHFAAILLRDPTPPSRLRPDLDPGLEAICLRCLARDPTARFASMADLADALDAWEPTGRRVPAAYLLLAALVALGAGLAIAVAGAAPEEGVAPASSSPLLRLDQALGLDPTCANLFAAADLADAAGLDAGRPDLAERIPDPERRSRLLFALHLRDGLGQAGLCHAGSTPALERLLADPAATAPWRELARAVATASEGSPEAVGRAQADLESAFPPGTGLAWADLLRGALAHFDPRRGGEARALLERALRLDPGLWVATCYLALIDQQRGELEEALRRLDEQADRGAPHPLLLLVTAWVLADMGEREEAEALIARAAPAAGRAGHHFRLRALHERRSFARALEAADEALRGALTPGQREVVGYIRARSLLALGEWREAERGFRELLDGGGGTGQVVAGRVEALAELLELEAARAELSTLVDPPPGLLRVVEACAAAAELRASLPSRGDLRRIVGERFQRGDWREMVVVLDRILEQAPGDTDALSNRALANRSLGRYPAVLRDLEALRRIRSLDPGEEETLVRVLGLLGARHREALEELLRRLESVPKKHWDTVATIVGARLELNAPEQRARVEVELEGLARASTTPDQTALVVWLRHGLHKQRGEWAKAIECLRAVPPGVPGVPTFDPGRRIRYLERRIRRG